LFQAKVIELKKNTIIQNDLIKNVDWDKVQEEILRRHNDERSKK
jgi:hypothetical protein